MEKYCRTCALFLWRQLTSKLVSNKLRSMEDLCIIMNEANPPGAA